MDEIYTYAIIKTIFNSNNVLNLQSKAFLHKKTNEINILTIANYQTLINKHSPPAT